MDDLISTARELCKAKNAEDERTIVGQLQKHLVTTKDASVEVIAKLKTGETVDLTSISDGADVDTITLAFQIGGKEEVVGPCKPKDANAYFDLFLE